MKQLFLSAAACCVIMLAACEGKTCVCYETINGHTTKTEVAASSDTRCNTLSSSTQKCVESYEEDIDPSAIAVDNKR